MAVNSSRDALADDNPDRTFAALDACSDQGLAMFGARFDV